ncbi:MAG: adenylate/guanylate cyclase domain-containing protein [Alphaproteobacteria bacterium]
MINLEEIFNRENIIDLSFFNFRNAITACYFADRDLRVLKVNENFRSFFPVLGDVSNVAFANVLQQLGVDESYIDSFEHQLDSDGHVVIPEIPIEINGEQRIFSLLSAYTTDPSFSYLNGVQGQFVDRTAEFELRREREKLLEEKLRDRELIEAKTRELERIAGQLAKYLSPQIYASIFSGESATIDTLARKNLTIFFSDIEGFTEISDGMEPERLSFFINTYLTEMANIALEHGGTIDKFIGDAVLIFFGDPETDGDRSDALKCAQMAIHMRDRVQELEEVWRENGISKALRVRMGINSGYCTVGNFGSENRMEYTVLGSPVNLAARLQTAAEADTILLGEAAYLLIEDVADCTRMEDMDLKGFARPMGCYRLNSLQGGEKRHDPVTRVGKHVAVSIPDRRMIREAIEELRRIQKELEMDVFKTQE